MNCVPQGALLALLTAILHCAMTSPVWMPQFLSGGSTQKIDLLHADTRSGRNIRHLPCVSRRTGETGVCMFAFACMKANGTHLGTCIDRFYFGSCCRISEENVTTIPNTEDNNLFPISTTTESKYYLSTFQTVQDNDNRVEVEDTQTIKPVKPIVIPMKKPSVPEKKPTPSATTTKSTTTPRTTTHSTTKPPVTKPETKPHVKPTTNTTSTTPTTRKPTTQTTSTTTRKPQTKPTKPPKTTTRRPPSTTRKPATTTIRPTTPTKPTKTTTRKPVTQTKPTQSTTTKPVTHTRPTVTTTKKPTAPTTQTTTVTQQTTTRAPVTTTTHRSVTQTTPTQTTTRKLDIFTETTETTTKKPFTQASPLETTTAKPVTNTVTTRKPVFQTKPPTTTRKPVFQTKPPTTTRKPLLTTTETTTIKTTRKPVTWPKPPTITTKKPLVPDSTTKFPPSTKPKPTVATTTKKPVETTTRKPPTKKPTIKTTERPTETTTTVPASLVTWTMVQEPPKTEPATTMTTTSVDWILVPVTTHPPSTDSSQKPGTTTSTDPDTSPDATTVATTTTITTITTMTSRPETTLTPEVTPSVMNDTLDIDLNMTDFRQVCGRRLFPESRIVGGDKSTFGKWPWQISLRQWRTSTYLHKCGAALLNENWAITAAHCVENVPPSDLLLRLGEHDLSTEEEPYGYQERRVQIVASHPQFDPRTFEYDLALLRFYEPVTFQPNILPICVPLDDTNFVGHTAYVTGWGRLYEDGPLPSVLQEVSVPVINNSVCETMYRSAGYIEHIPEIFICAGWRKGGFDSCEGDSGGPMVIQRPDKRWLLAGVISWGIGCAEPNQPGVYTRISEFREWINQILQF